MCPFINIGEFIQIPTYSACFIIGFAFTLWLTCFICKKEGNASRHVLYSSLYALIGIGLGAKLMYFISKIPGFIRHWDAFVEALQTDFWGLMDYAFGGLVFYGGLLGAIFGYWIYSKQFKVHINFILDNTVAYFPLLHAFGRIGCFLGGCCYGMEYYGPLAIQFPYNELEPALNAFPRFPVQLVEATGNIILFIVLFTLRKKHKLMPKSLLGLYLVVYAVMRTCLEFVRGDLVRGAVWVFTTSQWISLILLPVGIFLMVKNRMPKADTNQADDVGDSK